MLKIIHLYHSNWVANIPNSKVMNTILNDQCTVEPHLSGHLRSQADYPDKWVTFPIYNYDLFPNMCPDKWISGVRNKFYHLAVLMAISGSALVLTSDGKDLFPSIKLTSFLMSPFCISKSSRLSRVLRMISTNSSNLYTSDSALFQFSS